MRLVDGWEEEGVKGRVRLEEERRWTRISYSFVFFTLCPVGDYSVLDKVPWTKVLAINLVEKL